MRKKLIAVLVVIACAILAPTHPAGAQQAGNMPRIGFLALGSAQTDAAFAHAFSKGLREHGWVDGQNIAIEHRRAEGRAERLPELAAELVHLKVDLIVARSVLGALAAKNATTTIPILAVGMGDPVGTGLVANLAHPGGNVTGLSSIGVELAGKRLELLKQAMPTLASVAVLWDPANPGNVIEWRETQAAAQVLGMQPQSREVRGAEDFERAFITMAEERPDALFMVGGPVTFAHRERIANFAAQSRLLTMFVWSEAVDAGGLMSYGASSADIWRRAATYADKILKGAKPADLPVEQPTTLDLVINLKTAQAIGLTIPPSLLFQATEVIR
jgi:putative tryptophan/tyrosine transport system substrate-binding protein